MLLDEAEQLYNRIMNAITNICINKMPSDTKSPSQIPDIQDGLSLVRDSRKIFDTRELSQISLGYNNITFQVYPGPKITNVMSGEDESDTYSFS